jgi:hypothetical protein
MFKKSRFPAWLLGLLLIVFSVDLVSCSESSLSDAVGTIGPSGGYIFYDKGEYSDGWQYLEAAPDDILIDISSYTSEFGYYRTESTGSSVLVGTSTAIGTGKANTTALVDAMGSTAYTSSSSSTTKTTEVYSAKLCDDYTEGTYEDWFLPSKEELFLLYDNLKKNGRGDFSDSLYWSSSEYNAEHTWSQNFSDGNHYLKNRSNEYRVRPVRAF